MKRILKDGTIKYYKNHKLHRDDGPAIDRSNVKNLKPYHPIRVWYKNGFIHREDGSAYEWDNGDYEYYSYSQRHRIDGPAIYYTDAGVIHKEWHVNGLCHRIDGPAIEYGKDKFWYYKGSKHRIDGPAVEMIGGIKYFYLFGKEYLEEEYYRVVKLLFLI